MNLPSFTHERIHINTMTRWLAGVALMAAFVLATGCSPALLGSGTTTTRTVELRSFDRVVVHSSLDVRFQSGASPTGSIVADDNLQPLIKIEQNGSTLDIRVEGNPILIEGTMEVRLTAPNLKELRVISGHTVDLTIKTKGDLLLDISGNSRVTGAIETDALLHIELAGGSRFNGQVIAGASHWKLSGGSRGTANLKATDIKFHATGSDRLTIDGEGTNLDMELAGGSIGHFGKLKLTTIKALLTGASAGYINHNGSLTVQIDGNSKLYYSGKPNVEDIKTSGGGALIPRNGQ